MKKLCSLLLCSILASAAWFGCASENPNLVNPPSGLDSIYVRLVNFTNDNQLRSLSLAGVVQTAPVAPLATSATISSPSDSAIITILLNGTEEYRPQTRLDRKSVV